MLRVYEVLRAKHGREQALQVIADAVRADALAAGAAFAASAEHGPSLKHFATVLDVLKGDGEDLVVHYLAFEHGDLCYRVSRCKYLDAYAEMSIEPELAYLLSCHRDYGFAEGYDARLTMERSRTLGKGDAECTFRYTWQANQSDQG